LRRTGGTRATAPARARLPGKAGKPERDPARANKPISSAPFEHEVEKLAGQIAGDTEDQITIELARDAAEAELELARVGRLKVALTERLVAFGRFVSPSASRRPRTKRRGSCNIFLAQPSGKGRPKFAEAVRRAFPNLLRLQRYEARAVMRRDLTVRSIASTARTGGGSRIVGPPKA
jgi:hypothetical protein